MICSITSAIAIILSMLVGAPVLSDGEVAVSTDALLHPLTEKLLSSLISRSRE